MNDEKRNESHKNRPLIRKQDLLILFLVVLAAAGIYLIPRFLKPVSSVEARIYIRNELVKRIPLGHAAAEEFSLDGLPGLIIRCDGEGGICFLRSDCPDQLCVHSGVLRRTGDFAACLPNEVMISLCASGPQETEEGQADMVIGEGKMP